MLTFDLICFSHLRWNFVYQRPQHLLSRFAKHQRVFFIEEPIFDAESDFYSVNKEGKSLWIITPHIQNNLSAEHRVQRQKLLVNLLMEDMQISKYLTWYYTPMALEFSRDLKPLLIIFDCMDELSAFKFAPSELKELEAELLSKADIVFTGGYSLFLSKKDKHPNLHYFPSSIDKEHFSQARKKTVADPPDQSNIPRPRLGFYGVLDERLDTDLVEAMAALKPKWHFIYIGPIVKIDPKSLPQRKNIHYLGSKNYNELPTYLAGWDIALMPFALNESTRFISPTKTPEYLAGGKPVISTPIVDVVEAYGNTGLVYIGETAEEFISAATHCLKHPEQQKEWLKDVDEELKGNSWDLTWKRMAERMEETLKRKNIIESDKMEAYV
jgi:glycosyltransferase involved in cell wall biosynthesis